jgi:hypothetical protein
LHFLKEKKWTEELKDERGGGGGGRGHITDITFMSQAGHITRKCTHIFTHTAHNMMIMRYSHTPHHNPKHINITYIPSL